MENDLTEQRSFCTAVHMVQLFAFAFRLLPKNTARIFAGYKNSIETIRLANELPLISSRTHDHQSVSLLSDQLEPLNRAVSHINTSHNWRILWLIPVYYFNSNTSKKYWWTSRFVVQKINMKHKTWHSDERPSWINTMRYWGEYNIATRRLRWKNLIPKKSHSESVLMR